MLAYGSCSKCSREFVFGISLLLILVKLIAQPFPSEPTGKCEAKAQVRTVRLINVGNNY